MFTSIRSQTVSSTLLLACACAMLADADAAVADDAVRGETGSAAPNIVLIMADDLGYGDLSSYGHPGILTPNLDALASGGVRLTAFYAGDPVCTPSRAALLTGRYAIRSGMTEVMWPGAETGLPPEETTLAEALAAEGYQTAMVGKWHLGDRSPHMPTEHGFGSYFGLLYSNDMVAPWVTEDMAWIDEAMPPLMLVRDETPEREVADQSVLTTTYTEEAVARIEGFAGDAPYFLYLAYAMPHVPVAVPASRSGTSAGGLYGDVVETIDWSVGEVLAAIEARGDAGNTIIVFTSDNGPWLTLPPHMTVGGIEPWHVGSPGPLRGSKATTYEGGLRVPAVVRWLGPRAEGRVSSRPVSAMDLTASLAAAGGAASMKSLDGTDLSGLLSGVDGGENAGPVEFFYFRGAVLEGVRDARWKLRVSWYTDENVRRSRKEGPLIELFDLIEDPSERFDVARRHPDHVARLLERLETFARDTGASLALPPE